MKNTEMKETALNELEKVIGGANAGSYSEPELARIFDLYFEMYGITGAIPYLAEWGVTSGDVYLASAGKYWNETPYTYDSLGGRLAHLIYTRNH